MRIACGSTRMVLLIGDRAFKIGRVRPLRVLLRLCVLPFSQERREHFSKKYGHKFAQAVWKDMCAGLYANRGEYEYYQSSRDPLVMPTVSCFLGGWIVVQPRGERVSHNELRVRPVSPECEMTEPEQFARASDGRVVLVDYGRPETRTALRTV